MNWPEKGAGGSGHKRAGGILGFQRPRYASGLTVRRAGAGGAGGGARTPTSFRTPDFESSASANSATPASAGCIMPVSNWLARSFAAASIPHCPALPLGRHCCHPHPRTENQIRRHPILQRVTQFTIGVDIEGGGHLAPANQHHTAGAQGVPHPEFVPDIGILDRQIRHHPIPAQLFRGRLQPRPLRLGKAQRERTCLRLDSQLT
jgi:hypothetical protein